MVSTLEDQGGRVNGAPRQFHPCPGPGCKTKIGSEMALCSECVDKLPRDLRTRLEAALQREPDDSFELLINACKEELANQDVRQVAERQRRRKAR